MKLLFKDGQTLQVQSVYAASGIMHVNVINNKYEQLKHLFTDPVTTGKIMVENDHGEIVDAHENYTVFSYIRENSGGIFIVEMIQEGKDSATRLNEAEEEIKRIKENSVDAALVNAAVVVAKANAQVLSDSEALQAKAIYPTWQELVDQKFVAEKEGYKFIHENVLYKTINPDHNFQEQYVPGQGTESLYTRIDETHAGTIEDPIPYVVNMEVFEEKYYTEENILYKCIRDSGQALHNKAAELVGIYFQVVQE